MCAPGKQLRELFGYLKKTQSIVFSADGKTIWSGGQLWDDQRLGRSPRGGHLVTLVHLPGDLKKDAGHDDWLAL